MAGMADDLKHRIDAYMAHQHPSRYAKPPTNEPAPSIDEAVLKPMIGAKRRRSERHEAIDDAGRWIAWMIAYRAELCERLPQVGRPEAARKASLGRGRPVRHSH
jgi:hypothetical protein